MAIDWKHIGQAEPTFSIYSPRERRYMYFYSQENPMPVIPANYGSAEFMSIHDVGWSVPEGSMSVGFGTEPVGWIVGNQKVTPRHPTCNIALESFIISFSMTLLVTLLRWLFGKER